MPSLKHGTRSKLLNIFPSQVCTSQGVFDICSSVLKFTCCSVLGYACLCADQAVVLGYLHPHALPLPGGRQHRAYPLPYSHSCLTTRVNKADLIMYSFGATWPLIGCYKATTPMPARVYKLYVWSDILFYHRFLAQHTEINSMQLYAVLILVCKHIITDSRRVVLVLSRAPLIVADILLCIITLHTLRYGFLDGIRVRTRRSLSDIMLWNGTHVS